MDLTSKSISGDVLIAVDTWSCDAGTEAELWPSYRTHHAMHDSLFSSALKCRACMGFIPWVTK